MLDPGQRLSLLRLTQLRGDRGRARADNATVRDAIARFSSRTDLPVVALAFACALPEQGPHVCAGR